MVDASVRALDIALKPKNLWPGLFLVVLLASAGASLTLPYRRAVVVWFPDARASSEPRSRAELRYVPAGADKAGQAAAVVEEMLLGPLSASSRPISVPNARLVSSIRSGKTLYVDISSDILFGRPSASGAYGAPVLEPGVAIGYIERSLRWNFPFFRIVVTVGGQEPSWNASEVATDA
jgi:hypothetical protein